MCACVVGEGIANYQISAIARMEEATTVPKSSTYVAVYARVLRPYKGWCPSGSGYRFQLSADGSWSIDNMATASSLANGQVKGVELQQWHNLSLSVDADRITAAINGTQVAAVTDTAFDSGPAAVGTGFHMAAFDNLEIVALRPTAAAPTDSTGSRTGSKGAADNGTASTQAVFSAFTNIQRENASGWYGVAFRTNKDPVTVSHLSRFRVGGNQHSHELRLILFRNTSFSGGGHSPWTPVDLVVNETLASVNIDMRALSASGPSQATTNTAPSYLDSGGFVHAALSAPVTLPAYSRFLLVSQETATVGSDLFYGAAGVQPCAGSIGAGGTLPRLKMLTDKVTIEGGASTADPAARDGWTVLADWEPRAFGPVSFDLA